jgi:hypothetical protein
MTQVKALAFFEETSKLAGLDAPGDIECEELASGHQDAVCESLLVEFSESQGFCVARKKNNQVCGKKAKVNGRCGIHAVKVRAASD